MSTMTHAELLAKIDQAELGWFYGWMKESLRSIVVLHGEDFGDFPDEDVDCAHCVTPYPCPTIKAITKALS